MQNATGNNKNCSGECAPSGLAISGTGVVCNSTSYTATSVAGATYSWSVTPNLTITSGQGTATVTVRANGSGSGTISLNINKNACSFPVPVKTVQVGNITTDQLHIYYAGTTQEVGSMCPNTSYNLIATGPAGITFSNWTFQGAFSSTYSSGSSASVTTSSTFGGGNITVTASDACGASVVTGRTLSRSTCGGLMMQVSPNPASDFVNVELITDEGTPDQLLEEYELDMYDKNGKKVKTHKSKEKKKTIEVSDLEPDLYIIRVKYKEQLLEEQLVITR